ncbi:MAG: cation:dicarboxylase symporter family transporter, partial [Bacteroidales bacterium]|nr:cation:dicarboxylase symporter family transporter [Bacteroidales bacterium]
PFGTNMHKDGSVVSAVVKIVFLMVIVSATSPMEISAFTILWVSVVSSIVVGAIPSGGMTGELLICSILGFSPELAGSLLVIATIVDIPATLLNSGENVVAAVLVDKLNKAK